MHCFADYMIIKKKQKKNKLKEKKRSRILHDRMQIVINIYIYQTMMHIASEKKNGRADGPASDIR